MRDRRAGEVVDLPARRPEASREVDLLVIEEEPLVEPGASFEDLGADEHARPRDPVDLHRYISFDGDHVLAQEPRDRAPAGGCLELAPNREEPERPGLDAPV